MDILEIGGNEDGCVSIQETTDGLLLVWGADGCGDIKELSKEDILQIVKFLIKFL